MAEYEKVRNNEYWAWVQRKEANEERRQRIREKQIIEKMRQNANKPPPKIQNRSFQIPTQGPLNYLRYGATKNVSKMSNDEKIKRLLNLYKTYSYSNERKKLSNVNQRIFGYNSFTANGILKHLQIIRPSIKLPPKLQPIPRRMPKNEINGIFVKLGGSLNNSYNRKKANILMKSKINWINYPKRTNPLFLAYAIKANSNINNINKAYFNKRGKINQKLKQKVLNARNSLNWWNSRRHEKDPSKIVYVMTKTRNTGMPYQNRLEIIKAFNQLKNWNKIKNTWY